MRWQFAAHTAIVLPPCIWYDSKYKYSQLSSKLAAFVIARPKSSYDRGTKNRRAVDYTTVSDYGQYSGTELSASKSSKKDITRPQTKWSKCNRSHRGE
jgi:hypothetical protein